MTTSSTAAVVRPGDEQRLAESLTRDAERLSPAERRAEAITGGAFLLAAVVLIVLAGMPRLAPADLVVVIGVVALASRVKFAVPSGYTTPIVLAVVPALFLVPPQLVPPAAVAGLALATVPDIARRVASPSRLLLAPANAWFTVGPAAVLAAAGGPSASEAAPAVLVAALAAQLAGDLAASWARERMIAGISLREQLGEALWVYAVDIAFAPVGLLVAFAAQGRTWALALMVPLLGLLQLFAAERRDRMEQLVELSNAYRGTAMVLGDVVESDDAYTGEHTRGVVELALAVSDELGLDSVVRQRVEFGALLHDVGKVAVPKEIINKAGPLDAREWEIIKTHTIEGQRMLDTVGGLMRTIGTIVRAHHERWDGGGYPDGLVGDAIPIESRIVSACDTWNAMTTSRSYRVAMPVEEAAGELRRAAGTQLDPAVVDALEHVLRRLHVLPEPDVAPAARGGAPAAAVLGAPAAPSA